jgi:hypothetical protein
MKIPSVITPVAVTLPLTERAIPLYPVDTVAPPEPNLTRKFPPADVADIPLTITVILLTQLGIVLLKMTLLLVPALVAAPNTIG